MQTPASRPENAGAAVGLARGRGLKRITRNPRLISSQRQAFNLPRHTGLHDLPTPALRLVISGVPAEWILGRGTKPVAASMGDLMSNDEMHQRTGGASAAAIFSGEEK